MSALQLCLKSFDHLVEVGLGYAVIVCLYKYLMARSPFVIVQRPEVSDGDE